MVAVDHTSRHGDDACAKDWIHMQDFSRFIEECERSPRLNELAEFFSSTAAGLSGVPRHGLRLDRRLLPSNSTLMRFASLHQVRQGSFDQHYLCSIPYRYEEEIRLGCAILKYARARRGKLALYSLGTAEGTMARTICELGLGRIDSLSCSPNIENFRSFFAYGPPPHATFFHGPFHHLTMDRIRNTATYRSFVDGFDIILEDTTFQMYSSNRRDQIRFVSQNLKSDGLFLFVEKFRHENDAEYRRREAQKDFGFKVRFFDDAQIKSKEKIVLTRMDENEVTLSEMGGVLKDTFDYCYVTWNSGNFSTLVASNDLRNVQAFIKSLSPPAIPQEYQYLEVPYRLYPT